MQYLRWHLFQNKNLNLSTYFFNYQLTWSHFHMKFLLIGNLFRFFFGIANYLGKSLKKPCILFLPQRPLRRQATCYTSSLWASVRIQQTPAAHVKTSVTSECHFSTSRWNKYKQSWLQPGAHNPELGTFNFYSCHVDFTDQFLRTSQRNLQI